MAVHGRKMAELKSQTIKVLTEAFDFAGESAFGSCFQADMFFVKLSRKSSVFTYVIVFFALHFLAACSREESLCHCCQLRINVLYHLT